MVWILFGPTSPLYPTLWHEQRPFAALILPICPVSLRMQMTPPCHRHFTAIDGTHAHPDSAASRIQHRTGEITQDGQSCNTRSRRETATFQRDPVDLWVRPQKQPHDETCMKALSHWMEKLIAAPRCAGPTEVWQATSRVGAGGPHSIWSLHRASFFGEHLA